MWWYVIAGLIVFGGFMVFTGAPYVPSIPRDVRLAFTKLYKLGAHDVLVDIGSGDGIVLREARRRGARAVGYEINPLLALIARVWSWRDAGVTVRWANFWKHSLPDDVTVVYVFGDTRDIVKMHDRIVGEATRLGRPLWVISYGFKVPDAPVVREEGAHILYRCKPLRLPKGTV